jgi:hypothetical protein
MTDADRKRLAALLGMLGSSHAGERANAAEAVEKFRIRHRLTWSEILEQHVGPPVIEPMPEAPPPPHPWTPPPPPWTPPSPTQHSTVELIRESVPWLFFSIFFAAIVWGGLISLGHLAAR